MSFTVILKSNTYPHPPNLVFELRSYSTGEISLNGTSFSVLLLPNISLAATNGYPPVRACPITLTEVRDQRPSQFISVKEECDQRERPPDSYLRIRPSDSYLRIQPPD